MKHLEPAESGIGRGDLVCRHCKLSTGKTSAYMGSSHDYSSGDLNSPMSTLSGYLLQIHRVVNSDAIDQSSSEGAEAFLNADLSPEKAT